MDYEKAYKEALERAKNLHEDAIDMGENIRAKQCEIIFPELAESEDERIRKSQLDYWRSVGGKEWHGVPVQETIAWLEKQGNLKWTEEDSLMIDSIIDTIKWLEGKGATNMKIDWLKSLKKRMEGQQ